MYFDEVRYEHYVISYSQCQQHGGNGLAKWEQQTIVTVVTNSKRTDRCSRFKKCTYSNPVLWPGDDSTVCILHVFSYYDLYNGKYK
jgi:hypothetical protein